MTCIQEQKKIISQTKHKFITNAQTSIGYVNNDDKTAIYKTFGKQLYVSWSTSELRVRLAPLNRFKPSSIIFYWPFQGGTFLWILYVFFCLVVVMPFCASVYMCHVVTCRERADFLALVCGV